MKIVLNFLFCIGYLQVAAQFAGPVGSPNTTAIHKDSSVFVAWAKSCKVVRGYMDISNPSLGYASYGDSTKAIGKADGTGVVSLGDGGYAILTFTNPITDGPGWDFAVFENSFNGTFLELAFVEVSSDGVNFFRFPAVSNLPTSPQYDNAANMDCSKINNLAGKYLANYGTPFDLQELAGISGLDIHHITHIKVIDVVGSVNPMYGSFDSNGNIINDPWPTPFASCGFDLDAVGVIHQAVTGIVSVAEKVFVNIYPNPFVDEIKIQKEYPSPISFYLFNENSELIMKQEIKEDIQSVDLSMLSSGVYFVVIENENERKMIKLIKH
ncbi:MAG: T9SS type A sorting domain-containing protein [Bacteroidia bacterium]|nr:T9SS type A sorting domain-containing protein [Bacteroidia bacterium]